MRVVLINLEPRYRNLAVEKLRLYHQRRGDVVSDSLLDVPRADIVYCSSIFTFTPKEGRVPPGAICGGTGFDLAATLPPEVEAIEPHLNFGFTTRGCIRRCGFCVVPEKEGYIRAVGDLLSLWDGLSRDVTLLDNNILALPEHFAMVCQQARQHNIRLDFNQGLDHRLLTPEIVELLRSIRHKELRFAFDDPAYLPTVERAIDLLQRYGIRRSLWYVLVGYNTSFEADLFRVNYLRDRGQDVFVQRYAYAETRHDVRYVALARWANQHHIYHGMTWEQFLQAPANKRYRRLLYAANRA